MSKGRSAIPDLDALESPLLSPSSFSGLGGAPGSAIAERIFNDPHSWDDTSGDEGDYPEDIENDALAWFTEEIERLRVQSANVGRDVFDLSRGDKRESKEVPKREGGWKDIARRSRVRPISLAGLFEQSNDDFSKEIQQHLSKILDSGGINKHHIGPKTLYTPGSITPSTADSISTPLTAGSVGELSASATLSFLEYYGIYPDPDSPLGRKLTRHKTLRKPPRSKDTHAGFLRPVPLVESVAQSPPLRHSSVPPSDLEVPCQADSSSSSPPAPPGLAHRTSSDGHDQTPPLSSLHSRDNSIAQEVVASGPESSPRSRPLPIASTPSPGRVRRLPSPPESQPQVSSTPPSEGVSRRTTPPPQSSGPTSAAFLSPLKSSAAFSSGSFGSLRPPSAMRSPSGIPLGPRTRARSSDAGRWTPTVQPT